MRGFSRAGSCARLVTGVLSAPQGRPPTLCWRFSRRKEMETSVRVCSICKPHVSSRHLPSQNRRPGRQRTRWVACADTLPPSWSAWMVWYRRIISTQPSSL